MDHNRKELAKFTEQYLKPSANAKKLIVEDVDSFSFKLSLRKPPKVDYLKKVQPLEERTDLTVMHPFTKQFGQKRYRIHRYPTEIQVRKNVYRGVHMMNEDDILNLTGFEVTKFWSLCQLLTTTKLPSLLRSISIPAALLLYRYVYACVYKE